MWRTFASLTALALMAAPAMAQDARDVAKVQPLLDAERAAMNRLVDFDGVYAGPWRTFKPDGSISSQGTTVHRVGPFLGGTVKVMEGRNYSEQGAITFNGMIVLTFDPDAKTYLLHIYAGGHAFDTKPVWTPTGYYFEVAGPDGKGVRRVIITISPTQWAEQVYDRVEGRPPAKVFEMTLPRVGESDWPLGRPNSTPQPPR